MILIIYPGKYQNSFQIFSPAPNPDSGERFDNYFPIFDKAWQFMPKEPQFRTKFVFYNKY